MKLYTLTVSAHLDDLESLKVHLDVNLDLPDQSMRTLALMVSPAHLRKIADDLEAQQ